MCFQPIPICMQKHEQISKASRSANKPDNMENLHKIPSPGKLNNGDESQNNGYLEITFWVQAVLYFDLGGGYMSQITRNVSLSYTPKINILLHGCNHSPKILKYV